MKLKNFAVLVFIALFLVSLSGCSLLRKKYEKTETKTYTLNASDKRNLIIDNTNGNIKIKKNEKDDNTIFVRAEITKYVTKKELNETSKSLSLEIDTSGSDIRITDLLEKEEGHIRFNIGKSSKVNLDISVPKGIDITVDGTNGKFNAEDVGNNMTVSITNGSMKFNGTNGKITAQTTNGIFTADIDSSLGLDFETVNGSIKLNVGKNFFGNLNAEVVNGKINLNDVEIRNSEQTKKTLKGTIGRESDVDIKLNTVNGSITFNKK